MLRPSPNHETLRLPNDVDDGVDDHNVTHLTMYVLAELPGSARDSPT